MAATLTDYKARNRSRLRVEPPNQPPQPEQLEPAPVELVPVLSVMERMCKKNPQLLNLINTLDLVEVGCSEPIEPPPLNSAPSVSNSDADNRTETAQLQPLTPAPSRTATTGGRLAEIAELSFESNQCYTRSEAIERIARQTGVSAERATNGLTLMLEQHLLSMTTGGMYYLFDTTPF